MVIVEKKRNLLRCVLNIKHLLQSDADIYLTQLLSYPLIYVKVIHSLKFKFYVYNMNK